MVDSQRWLPLSDLARWRRLQDGVWVALPGLLFAGSAFQLGFVVGDILDMNGSTRLLLAFAFATAPVLVAAWIWTLLNPVPFVDLERGRLRVRGRTIDFEDIDVARRLGLSAAGFRGGAEGEGVVGIRFGSQDGLQASVVLWRGEGGSIADVYRTRLIEVISRSSIDYPTSPYDPKKRFARHNFPENLTKPDALTFVSRTHGPTAGSLPPGSQ